MIKYKTFIILSLFFFFSILFGVFAFGLYKNVDGDQKTYDAFYFALKNIHFLDVPNIAKNMLTSNFEFITYYIFWVGSNLNLPKFVFTLILNLFFYSLLFIILVRYEVRFFASILLLSNYYVLMLMVSAERLKISFIFILLSLIFVGTKRYILFFLSVLGHLQNIIFICSIIVSNLKLFLTPRTLFLCLISLSFIFFLNNVFGQNITEALIFKFYGYFQGFSFSSIYKITLMLLILLLILGRLDIKVITCMMTIAIGALVLGDFRINMIAFCYMVYIIIEERKTAHPLFIIFLSYFSIKSILFYYNIISFGNGFYDNW